ncbi:MAG: acetyl-CoA carboxylase biotin carboxylase subunit [Methylovirgula sp.]
MFKKILIANRGEIAGRIIKTAHRMGIACVAVYSQADGRAPFVTMADEAICIGPAPAAQSYLAVDRIIAACQASGAEAVHPGYGFLSESAAFAAAVEEAGLVFIGPNRRAIALMGDKIAAKQLARDAGVSTVPGFLGVIEDAAHAADIAGEIGYPVMLKASAGGGGKGMRIAYQQSEVAAAFARARSEAASAFGDDRIFIEKFIEHPRHIEIQILGDKFGNIIHLGERECSIQRRHQKIIEEAPSPCVDDDLRLRMGEQAIALARAVAYDSVGTVEFIFEQSGDARFYFLEMNTRLQVEHPVTELVTGIDLVEQMIKIAAGERLAYAQSDVHLRGWAIECRICAEDPSRDFLPSTGRITRFGPPKEGHHDGVTLRHDTGVVEGSEISTHYDPMIGKLITHAGDRAAAVAAQADALDQFTLEGIDHNILFLASLMQNARFRHGALSTDFIATEYKHGFASRPPAGDEIDLLAAVAASIDHVLRTRQMLISGQIVHMHAVGSAAERSVMFGRMRIDVVIDEGDDELFIRMIETGQARLCRSTWCAGMKVWAGTVDGAQIFVQVRPHLDHYVLSWREISVEASVYSRREAELIALRPEKKAIARSNDVRSPMPGLVKAILVQPGQAVKTGDVLCVIEAMKMEMMVRAQHDATIQAIDVVEGASLGLDALIMSFV